MVSDKQMLFQWWSRFQGCCDCPVDNTYCDGANCFVMDIAETSIPFIYYGKGYLYPAGDVNFPYDQVFGYEMEDFEEDILKHSFGLSSLEDKLKDNLPANITEKHIDVFMDLFYNL